MNLSSTKLSHSTHLTHCTRNCDRKIRTIESFDMPAQSESINGKDRINVDIFESDDDIVIAGMAGRFPESSNIQEFQDNLMNGVDMVTKKNLRWPPGLYGVPDRSGRLKDLSSFDSSFFGVHAKQASAMDPQQRILLETAYEAIVDAGYNPAELRGSKTGVFIGVSSGDAEEFSTRNPDTMSGYGLMGCSRALHTNRISYAFDFKGPSFTVDAACSSSMVALYSAVYAIKSNQCDAAIVGGSNLILKPAHSAQLVILNILSPDGRSKTFDAKVDGCARSEAISVMLLQKAKHARRVYATVVHIKVNTDGYKDLGITYPSEEMQYELMKELYDEVGIDPTDVSYIEAHGTGTKAGDRNETNNIARMFCNDKRKTPLLIGALKSNMGHSEATSGMCSIIKAIIAMETGTIPANLHFQTPNPEIPSLLDGRLKVVDRNMPFEGDLIGVNSFGFGGVNSHVLLRSNKKPKLPPSVESRIPKMVVVSGRTEEAVNYMLDGVEKNENDDEFLALIRETYARNIVGHNFRGYEILGKSYIREMADCYSREKRPIWFVFSGIGTQWQGMGKQLLCIDVFQRTIQRCADALKPEGLDLMNILLHATQELHEKNILYSFVTIAAIQVALVDLLNFLEIYPDGIVGHSVGELACAYADGTLTPEQTVLAAYWRGQSVLDSNLPGGSMAAVGLGWEETAKRCPPDIFPVCNNSAESVTICGPKESLTNFVEQLKEQKIFAELVNSSGYAFHSKYIAGAGPKLRIALEKIIRNPKPRSSKWISSSIPESSWNIPLAKTSSAAYHVNNLLSPVLFHEAIAHVPKNAITIEIAPHALLQAILRRSFPPTVTNIGLQKRDHADNLTFLLTSLGKLYNAGGQPKIAKLYPQINYPVGTGTPMISPLIKWDHSMTWDVPDFCSLGQTGQTIMEIDMTSENDAYIEGNTIDGRVVYPASGYLLLAWKTLANLRTVNFETISVIFEDVKFLRATIMPKDDAVKFSINILDGIEEFEICESASPVVTGKIRISENIEKDQLKLAPPAVVSEPELLQLDMNDIYKDLRLRGYEYHGLFQGIKSCDNRAISGRVLWKDKWITYIECMLQFSILNKCDRQLCLPTGLKYVAINPKLHKEIVQGLSEEDGVPVYNYTNLNVVKSGGIEIRGLKTSAAPKRLQAQASPKLERYTFIPYNNPQPIVEDPYKAKLHALTVLLQIVCENSSGSKLKIIEAAGDRHVDDVSASMVLDILYSEPLLSVDLQIATTSENSDQIQDITKSKTVPRDDNVTPVGQDLNLVLAQNILTNKSTSVIENLSASLKSGGFAILEETGKIDETLLKDTAFIIVARQCALGKTYVLLKKSQETTESKEGKEPIIVQVTEKHYSWIEVAKTALRKAETEKRHVLLVSQGEELFGMVGFMNCLRLETGGQNLSYVFIQDNNAPKFNLTTKFYSGQLSKQLFANVLKGGQWGCYRHLRLDQQTDVSYIHVDNAYANVLIKGDLSSLRWVEHPLKCNQPENYPDKEFCHVYYAPLNFRDIMLATGKLSPDALPGSMSSQDCVLGLEFAGRDSKGRRVMGTLPARGLATTVLADPTFMWEVPEKWTLEEASSIPVVYATSYYALIVRGRLHPGERVLIHAGAGGVGLASISIALHAGCEIFTTVGSREKKEFLKKTFPQLTDRHIGNSRDTSFEQLILAETNGKGVDIVLNSLADEMLQASIRCLARGGRFLEIGKFDLSNDSPLGMSVFLNNTAFHGILLDALFDQDCPEKGEVVRLVSKGIKNGAVRPLPTTVFTEQEIEQSFRYMATGKHIGKVIIKIRDEEPQKIVQASPKKISAIPRTYMNPDKSYIVVGGLGGFGLELANWLIMHGAENIILTSRSGVRTGYQALCIRRWREMNVNVLVSTVDVTTLAGAEKLIKETNKIAPVGGIFNLAAVLRDALFENLNEADFKTVALPKINVTENLDAVSRKLCPSLDYFVCFSSVSSGKGIVGQTNYSLANSTMERIMERRRVNALPGLAIQWAAVGDVGIVMETMGGNETEVGGTLPQRIRSCLTTLDIFLRQMHPVLSSRVLVDRQKQSSNVKHIDLLQAVTNIMGLTDSSSVDRNMTLTDLGIDSLMGIEIKQTLERDYDLILSPKEVRGLTFGKLHELSNSNEQSTTDKKSVLDTGATSL